MHSPRLVFAAPSSGSGKTTITCGVLQALKNRGKRLFSFKCGPDFLDPMFQEQILGVRSGTLDLFFSDEETLRRLYAENAAGAELAVIEGVMGFYDGLSPASDRASTWQVAKTLSAPVILIINARGQSLSALAELEGFLRFREDSGIRGVIFNQMSEHVFRALAPRVRAIGVLPIGFLPKAPELTIKSRHLGLLTPGEIGDLNERLQKLSEMLERTLDLNALLRLAEEAPALSSSQNVPQQPGPANVPVRNSSDLLLFPSQNVPQRPGLVSDPSALTADSVLPSSAGAPEPSGIKLAVAKDEAFCFLYRDNLRLLKRLGAELLFFSPLRDRSLPEGAKGLLLPGGYPELYAAALGENLSMRESVARALRAGLPCLAECGGFLYLHRELEDMEGRFFPMAGVIDAKAFRTDRLGRFGYITLKASRDSAYCKAGEEIRAHEFHYYESEDCGSDLRAEKPFGSRSWDCIHAEGSLFAGFPHLFYESNPGFVLRFLRRCAKYRPPQA